MLTEHRRPKPARQPEIVPASAGGLNKTSKLCITTEPGKFNSTYMLFKIGIWKFGKDMLYL